MVGTFFFWFLMIEIVNINRKNIKLLYFASFKNLNIRGGAGAGTKVAPHYGSGSTLQMRLLVATAPQQSLLCAIRILSRAQQWEHIKGIKIQLAQHCTVSTSILFQLSFCNKDIIKLFVAIFKNIKKEVYYVS
jgi:hypothetical protein